MNIKDFLLDNYIYIIIVIILIIITIIGFLADRQKNGGKKKKDENVPVPNNMNMAAAPVNQPITYQPTNNNPMNPINTMGGSVIPQANTPVSAPTDLSAMPNNGIGSIVPGAPQPVEPMNASPALQPEPMYQPLSEQKPVIPPTNPINNISNVDNNLNGGMVQNIEPTPVQPQPVMPTYDQSPSTTYNMPNMAPQPVMMNEVAPVQPVPMAAAPMPQPIPTPSDNAVPTPIVPPQPVMPQPMASGPVPQAPTPVQPVQPVMQQSVGFVYGPQAQEQNTNQQM